MPRTPVKIRASSLSELFDCPARWEAKYILNLRLPRTPRAQLGTAIHKSTAAFDQSTIDKAGITIDEAAGAAVDAIHRPDEEVCWDDEKPSDIEKIALSLHSKYCTIIAPEQNYKAVEVQCDQLAISDLDIILTGTTDRIREIEGGNGIVDIKSGCTAVKADGSVETKGHTYQIGVYELLAQHASGLEITEPGMIAGLQAGKTDKGQRVGTALIDGARSVLVGDNDSPGVLEAAAKMIHAGVFIGNPKSMMCGEKYCPVFNNCKFRK